MCGICGFTGKRNAGLLKEMASNLIHRGPDEDGFYSGDKVNLGIRRLSIIDLQTGHQPIHNEDNTVWLVFNGEIYNFSQLRKELEHNGRHRFYTDHSDSEVLVHLYEEYGQEFVQKLNGMFALAIWDSRDETLLLIRDRMGVKPLFYAFIENEAVFASEIKAILLHPGYRREPDYRALYHYFSFKCVPAPLTAFKGISCLGPGEMLVWHKGTFNKRRYWKADFTPPEEYNQAEAKEKIADILEDAVKLRMSCDVNFGAYLSGGIDSSSVVALMSRYSSKPIRTFSLGYEDELKNKEADLFCARRVARIFKTDHREYIMSAKELIRDMDKVIRAFDQPFSGTISTFFLTKLIRKHVKVALSGDGADELFGSYLSHRLAQPLYHYTRLYDKIMSGQLSKSDEKLFLPCDLKTLEALYTKSGGDQAKWRHELSVFTDRDKGKLFTNYFRQEAEGASSFAFYSAQFKHITARDPLNRILELEWNTQLPDQVLAFADFLSMFHSVEIRSPFLDYRLVEYVSRLPGNCKINQGIVKDILKKAVQGLLPDEIISRPKEGFVLPVYAWMKGPLQKYLKNCLSQKRIKKSNLLAIESVSSIVNDYYCGDEALSAKVWNLACFQLWWEEYFA